MPSTRTQRAGAGPQADDGDAEGEAPAARLGHALAEALLHGDCGHDPLLRAVPVASRRRIALDPRLRAALARVEALAQAIALSRQVQS